MMQRRRIRLLLLRTRLRQLLTFCWILVEVLSCSSGWPYNNNYELVFITTVNAAFSAQGITPSFAYCRRQQRRPFATSRRPLLSSSCYQRVSVDLFPSSFSSYSSLSSTSTTTSLSNQEQSDGTSAIVDEGEQEEEEEDDASLARSAFGTKEYWDDVYAGRGDFPKDEYSWYYGWNELKKHVEPYLDNKSDCSVLLPGIGNDPLLVDLVHSGYFRKLTAQDYSQHALDRQMELLDQAIVHDGDKADIVLSRSNVKKLPESWTDSFDIILEKGLLDAVYLSGDDSNVESAVDSLTKTLKPNGIFTSVSGVVPTELRNKMFENYHWIRDGTDDLKAGCFIFRKQPE